MRRFGEIHAHVLVPYAVKLVLRSISLICRGVLIPKGFRRVQPRFTVMMSAACCHPCVGSATTTMVPTTIAIALAWHFHGSQAFLLHPSSFPSTLAASTSLSYHSILPRTTVLTHIWHIAPKPPSCMSMLLNCRRLQYVDANLSSSKNPILIL